MKEKIEICLFLSDEEKSRIVTDLNLILRACGSPYSNYPSLTPKGAYPFHEIFRQLTGNNHCDAYEYLRANGYYHQK